MATNPYVNKVVKADGTTIIDISDTTATASDVLNSKWFYTAAGQKIQGTGTGGGSGGNVWQDAQGYVHLDDEGTTPITVEPLSVTQNGTYTATTGHAYSPVTVNVSGGGGGLEYEEGTWTPSEDVVTPTINFTNTHTTRPFAVIIADVANDTEMVVDSVITWELFSFHDAIGESAHYGGTSVLYGRVQYAAKGISSGSLTASGYNITNLTGTGTTSMERWVSSSGFMPYAGSSSRFFRAGRTYKWIAVWAPTT